MEGNLAEKMELVLSGMANVKLPTTYSTTYIVVVYHQPRLAPALFAKFTHFCVCVHRATQLQL